MVSKKALFDSNDSALQIIGQGAAIGLGFFIPISTAITTVLIMVVVMVWLFGTDIKTKKQFLFFHPLSGLIGMLVFLTMVGTLYSIGDTKSISCSLIDILRLALIPMLIYYYQPKSIAQSALWAFILAMVVTLFFAFLKVYADFPIGLKYTTGGVFKSHIKTSYFMAIAAFFLAFKMRTFTSLYRLLAMMVVLLMVFYLFFMSEGRIGYLTLVLCLLLLAWQWFAVKGLVLALMLSIIMVGGAYVTSSLFNSRINLLVQDLDFYHQGDRLMESSLGSRLQFANSSTELIAQKPFFGWGTGGYAFAYAKLFEGKNTLLTDNPHNEYLRVCVELGLFGLSLLLLFFFQQWRLCKQLPKDIKGFCQGILLTFMLGCFFNSWLKDFTEGYFYCLMSAICFSALPLPAHKVQVKAILH
ncbi:MAG: O-antigen ligase family protein [Proteobacteria bacterium]|nr:O-antigen ligase family protein [Pseudomonadota bacterium]